jgi:hypothetical protein
VRCAEKVAAAYRLGHQDGYEEGLAAAREAVADINGETPPPLPPSVGVPERRWT